jgi:hypothetical protein
VPNLGAVLSVSVNEHRRRKSGRRDFIMPAANPSDNRKLAGA